MFRGAFDQAILLGHAWCGEEHVLLHLVDVWPPIPGLGREPVEAAVLADIERNGPEVTGECSGCISSPSYSTIRGRAAGLALGLGSPLPSLEQQWAALVWHPDGRAARLLASVGAERDQVLARLGSVSELVPEIPPANPLGPAAERQAVGRGDGYTGDDHLLLALLAGDPDDEAGEVLRSTGLTHGALASWLGERGRETDPPAPPPAVRGSAPPNPRALMLFAAAEGLAASLSRGPVGSVNGLLAYLWQEDGQQVFPLEARGTSPEAVAERLAERGVALPRAPLPQPDRTPWGEKVIVPEARFDDVRRRLHERHAGCWGFNVVDGRHWVVAHAHVDLQALVDEVLAG